MDIKIIGDQCPGMIPAKKYKRYWLFGGDVCYPLGGMKDYQGSYDTLDEAIQDVPNITIEYNYGFNGDEYDIDVITWNKILSKWIEIYDSVIGVDVMDYDKHKQIVSE